MLESWLRGLGEYAECVNPSGTNLTWKFGPLSLSVGFAVPVAPHAEHFRWKL